MANQEKFPNQKIYFKVADIPIFGDLILAPMDGVSDRPFRQLTRSLGSSMSYTEFINAMDVVNNRENFKPKISFNENERPVVFQIFDDDPERMITAAKILREYNPDIIDVNLGCPSKSVSNRGAGSGLLKYPEKIGKIISGLVTSLDLPITAKMRIGWDQENLNYREIAHIVEESGAELLAVHARTKEQWYKGQADWDTIAEIKQLVCIPVIGNGDVKTSADIEKMKRHTACDGVMIARAAIGNPWIFSRLDRDQISVETLKNTMQHQLRLMLDFYGDPRGLILFRKFTVRYLEPYQLEKPERLDLLTTEDSQNFLNKLESILASRIKL
ncbi:MAG: tRNA dihydrouridine synthase DusB [Anaerolineaceae bacterium]|nr:tRNA dihydrouridine synthase DusB [Anaerolineaceae bacterium]